MANTIEDTAQKPQRFRDREREIELEAGRAPVLGIYTKRRASRFLDGRNAGRVLGA